MFVTCSIGSVANHNLKPISDHNNPNLSTILLALPVGSSCITRQVRVQLIAVIAPFVGPVFLAILQLMAALMCDGETGSRKLHFTYISSMCIGARPAVYETNAKK